MCHCQRTGSSLHEATSCVLVSYASWKYESRSENMIFLLNYTSLYVKVYYGRISSARCLEMRPVDRSAETIKLRKSSGSSQLLSCTRSLKTLSVTK